MSESGLSLGLKIILAACVLALVIHYGPPILRSAMKELPGLTGSVSLPFPPVK